MVRDGADVDAPDLDLAGAERDAPRHRKLRGRIEDARWQQATTSKTKPMQEEDLANKGKPISEESQADGKKSGPGCNAPLSNIKLPEQERLFRDGNGPR